MEQEKSAQPMIYTDEIKNYVKSHQNEIKEAFIKREYISGEIQHGYFGYHVSHPNVGGLRIFLKANDGKIKAFDMQDWNRDTCFNVDVNLPEIRQDYLVLGKLDLPITLNT